MISIRIFTKISLILYFSSFSYGNALAQNNECPEIPSQQLTISLKEIPLFTTPESNGEVAYIAKDNETLQLLEPTAQYIDGICWYRIQPPDGIPQSELWLATQKEEETQENSPLSTPEPTELLTSPEPTSQPAPKTKKSPRPRLKPTPQKQEIKQSSSSISNISPNQPLMPSTNQAFQNQFLITFFLGFFLFVGSCAGLIAFFFVLSLSAQNKKLLQRLQASIEFSHKEAKKIDVLSKKIINLEKKILVKPKPKPIAPELIDLEIINLLRTKGPISLSQIQSFSQNSPALLKQRINLLIKESLIYPQPIFDTTIYSLSPPSESSIQLVNLIVQFNAQNLDYFQNSQFRFLTLILQQLDNPQPPQLEECSDHLSAPYLMTQIEEESWLIPNIMSPEIAKIMRTLGDRPELFTVVSGSGSLYLIKPAKLKQIQVNHWTIAESGECQWLNCYSQGERILSE
jgi:hypothetical protein